MSLSPERTLSENQKKWVDALRSGKYKQGTRYLRDGDKFCCLGVACDILGIDGKEYATWWYEGHHGTAPKSVVKLMGLRDEYGTPSEGALDLTQLNDRGKTFEEIADELESGKYFV